MFWRMALPLVTLALIVTFIFQSQATWTYLFNALVYLHNERQWTLSSGCPAPPAVRARRSLFRAAAARDRRDGDLDHPDAARPLHGQRHVVKGIAT